MNTKQRKFQHPTTKTKVVLTYSFTPRGRFTRGYMDNDGLPDSRSVFLNSLDAVDATVVALLFVGFVEQETINLPPKPEVRYATEGKVHKGMKVDTRSVYHPGGALYSHASAAHGTVEDFLPGGGLAVRFHGKDGATTVADFTKAERAKIIVIDLTTPGKAAKVWFNSWEQLENSNDR